MPPSPCKLTSALPVILLIPLAVCSAASAVSPADLAVSPAASAVGRFPAKQGTQAGQVQTFRQHLEILTSEEMDGRGTGSPGGMRAIEYLEEQMRAAGLATLPGFQGSFRQEFALADPRPAPFRRDQTGLSWPGDQARTSSTEDVALPFRFSMDGDLEAGLAFVGYGLEIPELAIDDYAGLDVAGKIVLVLRGAPGGDWRNGPLAGHGQALRFSAKIANAEAAGAVGFLLVGAESGLDRQHEAALLRRALSARGESKLPALWITRPTAEKLLFASGQSLNQRQREIDLAMRSRPQGAIIGAIGSIEGMELHLRVRMEEPRRDLQTANLVGLLRGGDPELRGEYIVIGAHHDHLGRGAFGSLATDGVGWLHPGADDNASGLAALLMLAAQMVERQQPATRRSLLFVSFGAEELGLHGSRYFLANCPVPRQKIVAMINLDMIGRAGGDRLRIEGVASGLGLEALVRSVCNDCGCEVRIREAASPRSDHWTFLRAGIPALFLNTGIHEQYHRPSDVAALVELAPALRVVEVVGRLIEKLGDLDQALQFSSEGMRRSFLRSAEKK